MVVMGNRNKLQGPVSSAVHDTGPSGSAPEPVFGIVTALPEEFAAVRVLLDDAGPPRTIAGDRALYVLGTMPSRDESHPHRVVLTLLGDTGNSAAAEACANLIRSFPSVDNVIMCGIACGVPNPEHAERHVRLGDIVVATWGIADYDHVVETDAGRRPRQPFPAPSPMLVRLARYLAAVEISGERPWEKWITDALAGLPAAARPADSADRLHAPDDPGRPIPHPSPALSGHRTGWPKVHHGLIGSADRSLRSARVRDALAADQLIAFEMEGKGIGQAGFAGGLEWFVVRGVSDYGDMHTGQRWRGYAAVVAAAYVRALLAECPPLSPRGGHPHASGGARPDRTGGR
jgi:nucleoside phosphorylase